MVKGKFNTYGVQTATPAAQGIVAAMYRGPEGWWEYLDLVHFFISRERAIISFMVWVRVQLKAMVSLTVTLRSGISDIWPSFFLANFCQHSQPYSNPPWFLTSLLAKIKVYYSFITHSSLHSHSQNSHPVSGFTIWFKGSLKHHCKLYILAWSCITNGQTGLFQ